VGSVNVQLLIISTTGDFLSGLAHGDPTMNCYFPAVLGAGVCVWHIFLAVLGFELKDLMLARQIFYTLSHTTHP
jgi:hypothetical protein